MRKTMNTKNGVRLLTNGKYVGENIEVVPANASNIIPQNIKKNVQILGVTGTLDSDCDVFVLHDSYKEPEEMFNVPYDGQYWLEFIASIYNVGTAFTVHDDGFVYYLNRQVKTYGTGVPVEPSFKFAEWGDYTLGEPQQESSYVVKDIYWSERESNKFCFGTAGMTFDDFLSSPYNFNNLFTEYMGEVYYEDATRTKPLLSTSGDTIYTGNNVDDYDAYKLY